MVGWGHAVRGRSAADWVGRAIDNRLPPSAIDLPPSAKTCHDLPWTVSFEEPFRYPEGWFGCGFLTCGSKGCVGSDSGYVDQHAQRDRCLGGP